MPSGASDDPTPGGVPGEGPVAGSGSRGGPGVSGPPSSPPPGWLPPRHALAAAAVVVGSLAVVATAAGVLVGAVGALAVVLGMLSALPVAVVAADTRLRAAVVGLATVAAVVGLVARDRMWVVVLAVVLAGLVQAPLSARGASAPLLPAVVVLCATTGLPDRPVVLGGWLLVGAVLALVLARVLGVAMPVVPLGRRLALGHAVATAVACGLATVAAAGLDLDHGYWLVMTAAYVLRPTRTETTHQARERVGGTVAGLVVATVVLMVVPGVVAVALGVVFTWLTTAWAAAGDVRRMSLYVTPVIVLFGSSGVPGTAVRVGTERVVFILVGALLAAAAAGLVRALDQRVPR